MVSDMSEHSIEFLGQKFSYPNTWQGAFSVLIISVSISFLAFRLTPEQISSYGGLFNPEESKKFESDLVSLNKKLSNELSTLKSEFFQLTKLENIPTFKKQEIASIVEESDKRLNAVYETTINNHIKRKNSIKASQPKLDVQELRVFTQEEARISKQIGLLQQQQQQQQTH